MDIECYDSVSKFTINSDNLQPLKMDTVSSLSGESSKKKANINDQLFIEILLWTLGKEAISCNLLMREFNIGWKRADNLMKRLNTLGIVEDLDTKLPRKVLTQSFDDMPKEALELLEKNGYIVDVVSETIHNRYVE